MKLCSAWLVYWGRRFGMSRREVMATRLGEMLELIDCHAIANGSATLAKSPITSFEDALKVR